MGKAPCPHLPSDHSILLTHFLSWQCTSVMGEDPVQSETTGRIPTKTKLQAAGLEERVNKTLAHVHRTQKRAREREREGERERE